MGPPAVPRLDSRRAGSADADEHVGRISEGSIHQRRRRGILGSSYTGSCIARSRRARIAAVDPLALDRGHAPCNAYGWIFEIPHSPVLVLAQIPGILPFAYGVGWARGAGYTWGERTSEKRSIFNGFSRPHFCLSPTYLCVSRHLPHRSTDGSYCARDYPVGAPIPERVGPGRG